MASPLVRVPQSIQDEVLTLCRLERAGLPVKSVILRAIAELQADNSVNKPVNADSLWEVISALSERVKQLEQLTELLTAQEIPTHKSVNSKLTYSKHLPTPDADGWLTVEDAWAIAATKGCSASLSTFRRWARGNKAYPNGDEAVLERWGFIRDTSRLTEGNPRNPARFLKLISEPSLS
ncbi:hypothetical protein [Synechococcus elongatus]|uniref:hypothetical protein n=1 Tax=Synechococcus elongatus TaxID=32046 RepID=UPI0030D60D64